MVNLARLAGFVPSKRPLPPGNVIVWQARQLIELTVCWKEARTARVKQAVTNDLTAHE